MVTTDTAEREELVSLEQAADQLSVSKSTLYRMLDRGEVKGRKVGRQWRFRISDLKAYLERGPQAVALSTVSAEDAYALLDALAGELVKLEAEVPPLPAHPVLEALLEACIGRIIRLAIASRASDIHFTPERVNLKSGPASREDLSVLVQVRIDGVLSEAARVPGTLYPALVNQVKNMAGLNAEERSLPQDGRIHFCAGERDYDLRLNTMPTVLAESVVCRILDAGGVLLGLEKIGMSSEDLARLRRWNGSPSGLIISTGPTGSGKTTTLYSCLLEIAGPTKNTLTVEDPVEYLLPYTRQTSVLRRSGLTFTVALRAFLRQDPDVIMVGEIRDLETAEIIVQAALTGHLVYTTLHAENAPTGAIRLLDMGVEPFLISGCLRGVMTQRLARKLCPNCKEPVALQPEVLAHVREMAAAGGYLVPGDAQFYQAQGCEQCFRRGYRGRTGLFELLEFTPAVREAMLRGASKDELTRAAVSDGMYTLLADGIRKAVEGITTVDEVLRVAMAH
ncbi:MAG: GspE/PulE family protein [Armatimonadota bacterium]